MKKIVSCILIAMLAISVSVQASASGGLLLSTTLAQSPATGNGEGTYNVRVEGDFSELADVPAMISVDIAWSSMNFTYTASGNWLPEEHRYDSAEDSGWSQYKSDIVVTNHSNTGITALFSFAKAAEDGPTGTFYTKSGEVYTPLTLANQNIGLDTAEGTAIGSAPSGKLYFGIGGDPITSSHKLGTVTVKIAKGKFVPVTTDAELRTAIENGENVKLMNAITLSSTFYVYQGFELDLNGYTLTAGGSGIRLYQDGIHVSITNGTLKRTGGAPINVDRSLDLTLSNCTLETDAPFAMYAYGGTVAMNSVNLKSSVILESNSCTMTATNCTFTGNSKIAVKNGCSATLDFDPSGILSVYNEGTVINNGDGTYTIR